ncbi:MAG: NAD(P)H-dependent oxidoreductase [Myxococcota bacterium]
MKVLGFAASNSSKSINKALVRHALDVLKAEVLPGAETRLIDLNDYEMPIYSADRQEANGIPDLAHQFLNDIESVDAVIISFAEHNGSYSVAFKNVFDWASRENRKVYQQKKLVLLSTAPGGAGGRHVLAKAASAAPHCGGEVMGTLSVPRFGTNFDRESGRLTDPELQTALRKVLAKLK